jgi:N-acetylmuramoyl-L-alanine amidase
MTRTTDQYVANEDRLSYYRQANPDLLISIHLNSSVNPVDVHGTATYYKHPFCEPFNRALHAQMLGLGLSDFGNNGGFNFILNNPTEFPDALIETLFISNPEDEMHVLDEGFREQMVARIVAGIKDFLREAEQDKVTKPPTSEESEPSEETPGSDQ